MMDSSQNNYLIQALSSIARRIEERINTMPDEMLVWQPDEDEWSVQMVIAHLLHCESLFQRRLKRIVTETNPVVVEFGPQEATPFSSKSCDAVLQDFQAARQETLSQIYTYSPDDWERPAIHTIQGQTTLKEQIRTIVNHDTEHLGQIHDLCEIWHTHNNHQEITE